MPTETLPTRTESSAKRELSHGFVLALLLHAFVFGLILAWTWIHFKSRHNWGDQNPTAGSIQASMVDALPLPPKQLTKDNAVLTSDKPSIAPTPPPPEPNPPKSKAEPVKPKAEPPPKPNEVLIPTKTQPKPTPKAAEREQPEPPRRAPAPPPPPTPKATTGETAGVQIPESISQFKNGTAAISVEERSFGDRYAYYIRLMAQKINESKSQQDPDPPSARGKQTAVRFTVIRDGTPIDAEIVTRSGSPALDTSLLRAIQHIDSFGPLPQGDHQSFVIVFTDH